MAFRLGERVDVPKNIENTYLIPVVWLSYGIEQGNLTLDDKKFSNSLQGSVYYWWLEEVSDLPRMKQKLIDGENVDMELWLVYRGDGIVDYFYYPSEHYCNEIESDRIKSGKLYICGLCYMIGQTKNEQKTINSSVIQLFPGCGVTMQYSCWF